MASNYFTNEDPNKATNTSGVYGIVSSGIDPTMIVDGLTDRGAGLGKLGSSMPSPMARLFLFSAAFREVNALEEVNHGSGHIGKMNQEGELEPTPYHDILGEMLDMLEFVFKYGGDPDFHVRVWNLNAECAVLGASANTAHGNLADALRSAFNFGQLQGHNVALFEWGDEINRKVIGGTSPISLVYTNPNLREELAEMSFTGNAGNQLFGNEPWPLHKRDRKFRECLYRMRYTDLVGVNPDDPLYQVVQYVKDSAANYDEPLDKEVSINPGAYGSVQNLTSQGAPVKVRGIQLRIFDNRVVVNPSTSDYILKPTVGRNNGAQANVPMILTKHGDENLTYVDGRKWNMSSDRIDPVLPADIKQRYLPGYGQQVKYPYLTVNDFFEEKVIEVSYGINRERFFTGSKSEMTFLLPLKKVFFEYFRVEDLVSENGEYTDMLTVQYDEERDKLTVRLTLPLVNGHKIVLHKTYDTKEGSVEKTDCYDGSDTFDFAVFPFYRLEPNTDNNVYNVMIGSTVKGVSMDFYESSDTMLGGIQNVKKDMRQRLRKGNASQLNTYHIRVNGAFTFAELTAEVNGEETRALIIPIFRKVNSNPELATKVWTFGIDFGTTNTHVSMAETLPEKYIGQKDVKPFSYDASDTQVVLFNNKEGAREFGSFTTAIKREMAPFTVGDSVAFPMRTATYQIPGTPTTLEMFFNTNIGFNYGEDISRSNDYKTNIKWDRFDTTANDRMSTFFAQMLWMMKNKSVLNNGSDKFTLVVTHPLAMRPNDLRRFQQAWTAAQAAVQCNVEIKYRSESAAPYYSYLSQLGYGEPYANMDIGGGTTDILYYNPYTKEANVFSAFFAANDLWNDGIERANSSSQENGFVQHYKKTQLQYLGDRRTEVESVYKTASASSDIISYLFSNDSWTKLSNTIQNSRKMMQLPVIHFSSLIFYMAYSLHMAEVDLPKKLSFTGMGSKYIQLLSAAESDISKLVNAIFRYAGKALGNSSLADAAMEVSFAPNPKEVTATGALISVGYPGTAISPTSNVFYGYEEEDPEREIRYQEISSDVEDGVVKLFMKFVKMFDDLDVQDVLGDIGYSVDKTVAERLGRHASHSLRQMKESSMSGQQPTDKLKEPMFFWPLKNALYEIGKELANNND